MKRIILVGRTGCGKTTLTRAIRGCDDYRKTQYINRFDHVIDTPGEYAETRTLARALALYSYEADVVGFLLGANEPQSLYSPNLTPCLNRECVGIVTQIDSPRAAPDRAEKWLHLSGCTRIFHVSALTGHGMGRLMDFLKEPA
ncbi:MAG: EutP/PduV family microcompartment system protein [Synergistaceae bacterium]|jgi:ethanolamine utilization protein EutP|nr:EutP/PduV family microcompartment system protein [Synergistaceae bacterium]